MKKVTNKNQVKKKLIQMKTARGGCGIGCINCFVNPFDPGHVEMRVATDVMI